MCDSTITFGDCRQCKRNALNGDAVRCSCFPHYWPCEKNPPPPPPPNGPAIWGLYLYLFGKVVEKNSWFAWSMVIWNAITLMQWLHYNNAFEGIITMLLYGKECICNEIMSLNCEFQFSISHKINILVIRVKCHGGWMVLAFFVPSILLSPHVALFV